MINTLPEATRVVVYEPLLEPFGYIPPIEAEEKYKQALKSDKIAA
jgi:hypothetical protein